MNARLSEGKKNKYVDESVRALMGRSGQEHTERSTAYPRFAFSRVHPFRVLSSSTSTALGGSLSCRQDERFDLRNVHERD